MPSPLGSPNRGMRASVPAWPGPGLELGPGRLDPRPAPRRRRRRRPAGAHPRTVNGNGPRPGPGRVRPPGRDWPLRRGRSLGSSSAGQGAARARSVAISAPRRRAAGHRAVTVRSQCVVRYRVTDSLRVVSDDHAGRGGTTSRPGRRSQSQSR